MSTSQTRKVIRVAQGVPASDGAGVKLTRVIGTRALQNLDPFLMLDAFGSDKAGDYLAGFPDHPHRGFETVTYMLEGRMQHQDNKGNKGDLGPGSVQWMTAGRGIVHSEMPLQESGRMAGFQLWVNLPAKDKMCEPRYQDIPGADVPEVKSDTGATVKVLAGTYGGVEGPVKAVATDPTYFDVKLAPQGAFAVSLEESYTSFAYVFEGEVAFGDEGTVLKAGQLAVFSTGAGLSAAGGTAGGRFILLAGKPLKEPIAQYGPFVMNTMDEIRQAVTDFQDGKF